MTRRHYAIDIALARPTDAADLPLFSNAQATWPERPPAVGENHALELDGTIEGRYTAWRATEDGERVFTAFLREACGEVARGATRLSAKGIWERVRSELNRRGRVPMNNDYHAPMVREAEDAAPLLRDLFEKRLRIVP